MKTKHIDITPTWSNITPLLCHTIEFGTPGGAHAAAAELKRMADLADRYNHIIRIMGESVAREYLETYWSKGEAAADLAGVK
jgi:hypothetical protein